MDKFVIAILPKDITIAMLDYMIDQIYMDGKIFSKYEYVINTFAKNIGYTKNRNLLESKTEEYKKNMFEIKRLTALGMERKLRYVEMCELHTYETEIQDYFSVLYMITNSLNIGMAKYLNKLGCLRSPDLYVIMINACEQGYFEMLKFLVENMKYPDRNRDMYDYSGTRTFMDIYDAFIHAGANGHCKMLRYMVSKFSLTTDDVMHFKYVFQKACDKGNVKTLKYLNKIFGPNYNNLNLAEAFDSIVHNNHFKMLRHMISVLKLDGENIMRLLHANDVLRIGYSDRDLENLKHAIDILKLNRKNAIPRHVIVNIYRDVYVCGFGNVLKYYEEAFEMTPEETLISTSTQVHGFSCG